MEVEERRERVSAAVLFAIVAAVLAASDAVIVRVLDGSGFRSSRLAGLPFSTKPSLWPRWSVRPRSALRPSWLRARVALKPTY